MKEAPINQFLTLDEVVQDSDELMCTGCNKESCVHTLLSEEQKISVNEAMHPDRFLSVVRCLAMVVRKVSKHDSVDVPEEFVRIGRMSNLAVQACQEYKRYTNGQVLLWDGDVRRKLYGNRRSLNVHL
jgi:hypothetical protein